MKEIRESLCAVNMVSLTAAMAYQEMGETETAKLSLQYYADYIQRTYLATPKLVERLDMIALSPEAYWSKTLPDIEKKIQSLPCCTEPPLIGVAAIVGGTVVTVATKGKINLTKKK